MMQTKYTLRCGLKALQLLKEQKKRHQDMADSMRAVYFDDELDEAIEELETIQQSLKLIMLNYDECYDKLTKSLKYIIDLENQIKEKSNGWRDK